jgi:predicted ATPase
VIDQIEFRNFKCFKSLQLPLRSLTLLTGFNAAGKSTTIQSLLLLSQTLRMSVEGAELRLNGPLLRLGTPGEVLNQDEPARNLNLELSVASSDTQISWTAIPVESDRGRALRISAVRIADSETAISIDSALRNLLPSDTQSDGARQIVAALRDMIYVSALRRLDTEVFPAPDEPNPIQGDVGTYGEFAPWWLHQCGDLDIDERRCSRTSGNAMSLRAQVAAWLGELFPGAEANAIPISKTRLLRLELRTASAGEWRSPANIGYGLSYAFPIIVAGLVARRNQLLVVDSPEAHLHPRGQSRMARFLAHIAASGVQIILETHSDHVLNGLRIAIRDSVLPNNSAATYFFGEPGKGISPQSLQIDSRGNVSSWPEGFFDQSEADLASLAGWA